MWSAIALLLAVMVSNLEVSLSGGSSVKETSWAISARVLTYKSVSSFNYDWNDFDVHS